MTQCVAPVAPRLPHDTPAMVHMSRRAFGEITKLPSGKYRARYRNPDNTAERIGAPSTFRLKQAAQEWLAGVEGSINRGAWEHPDAKRARIAAEQALEAAYSITMTGEWVQQWLDALQWQVDAGDKADSGLRSRRDKIRRFDQQYGHRQINTITNQTMQDFWDWLLTEKGAHGKPLAPSTRNDCVLHSLSRPGGRAFPAKLQTRILPL